jgi:hypothetical protein
VAYATNVTYAGVQIFSRWMQRCQNMNGIVAVGGGDVGQTQVSNRPEATWQIEQGNRISTG